MRPGHQKVASWVSLGPQKCILKNSMKKTHSKVVPSGVQVRLWGRLGAHLEVPTLRKHQKHTGISMFSRCPQNHILSTSGHSFCSPGPQKGAPERPREAPRTPKPPIWRPNFDICSQLLPLRPQVRSQGLPNWPSQTQNDPKDALQASKIYQNSLKNPTPHTKD